MSVDLGKGLQMHARCKDFKELTDEVGVLAEHLNR